MHTDKNYSGARDRISDSLARRVTQGSTFPYEQRVASTCACRSGEAAHPEHTRSWGLEGYPLSSVYAPLQAWRELYDEDAGFNRGTIFKELDLPFVCGDKKGGNCRGR